MHRGDKFTRSTNVLTICPEEGDCYKLSFAIPGKSVSSAPNYIELTNVVVSSSRARQHNDELALPLTHLIAMKAIVSDIT